MRRFRVGQKAELRHIVTLEDVTRFVEITGDDNPLHVDRGFAERTPFKGTVAHGMLAASFVSAIVGKKIPGEGGLWLSQNLDFLLPVRIGDELTIRAEIAKVHENQRVLTLKTAITNQHKQVVLTGEGKVKVLELAEVEAEEKPASERGAVLITGASRGIGAQTAIHLAKQGFPVGINYRSDRAGAQGILERIRKENGSALLCQADVSNEGEVTAMVGEVLDKFGTISGLVNNATSRIIRQGFESLEWPDIQGHLDVQVKGAFNCVKAVIDEFKRQGRGSVVNVSTIAIDSMPPPQWTGYVLGKAALHALTKSLAAEYGPKGIRFNLVAPGMTDTGLLSEIPEKTRLVTAMQSPLRKLGRPIDVAHAIAFLLSDEASHITGETLRVCGGQVMI